VFILYSANNSEVSEGRDGFTMISSVTIGNVSRVGELIILFLYFYIMEAIQL
jgi:hypothetical protein